MLSEKNKALIAVAIVLGGLIVLYRSYQSTRPPSLGQSIPAVATEEVKKALDPSRFTVRPTREEVPSVLEDIRFVVVEQALNNELIRGQDRSRAEDLGEAFVERLRFMFVPDPERDFDAFSRRGESRSYEVWASRFEKYISSQLDQDGLPALDPSGVRVVLLQLVNKGKISNDLEHLEQGFGVSTGRGVKLAVIPDEPLSEGMLVVEVVLPMERRDVRNGELVPTIQGYRFTWHTQMKKWIAFESVVYDSPGHAFTNPPL